MGEKMGDGMREEKNNRVLGRNPRDPSRNKVHKVLYLLVSCPTREVKMPKGLNKAHFAPIHLCSRPKTQNRALSETVDEWV